MLPALPTGMQWTSGASPSTSTISKAPVFWPSMRYGLTELTTVTGARSPSSRTIVERLVEVAADLQHPGAVDQRLGQLAEGDVALGDEHRARQPGPGRVGGGRRRGVAGGRADHRLGALLHRLGDGQGHAPVLERAGGVEALVLEVDVGADPLADSRGAGSSGVPPSSRVTTGVSSLTGRKSRYSSISPRQPGAPTVTRAPIDPEQAADAVDGVELAQAVRAWPARRARGRCG